VIRGVAGSSSSAVFSPFVTTTSAELRPSRDRARCRRRRRPDVDEHRLAVLQQRGRGLGDRHLLRREARDAVLERLLLARYQPRDRTTANAMHLAPGDEGVQVPAHRHLRDPETAAQLADPHELAVLDLREYALAP
jgi:hypothetical protein